MSNTINRALYLKNLSGKNSRVFRPLIRCLSPTEACELLDLDFGEPSNLREAILEQILVGMRQQFEDRYKELIEDLLANYEKLPVTRRVTWGYVLDSLCRHCDDMTRQRIIKLFLYSDRKDFRNRAYNILSDFWDSEVEQEVVAIWLDKYDYKGTVLLLERAAPEFIQEHFSTFYYLLDLNFMGKLFSRVPTVEAEMLLRLKEDDAITYTYVSATLGQRVTEAEAVRIYNENKTDRRLGILLWAFGQMGHWDVLVHIDADMHHATWREENSLTATGVLPLPRQ